MQPDCLVMLMLMMVGLQGQEIRRKTVQLKLNTIRSEFKGKNVLMVDDSIGE